jgi:hypothetical protein
LPPGPPCAADVVERIRVKAIAPRMGATPKIFLFVLIVMAYFLAESLV